MTHRRMKKLRIRAKSLQWLPEPPVTWSPLPLTSLLTAFTAVKSDASQAYVSGKLLPQDLCTCCPPAPHRHQQCSSSDIFLADSLTSFKSLLRCLLLSEGWADQLFKKFQLTPQPPHHPYSLLFSPRVFITF